MSLLVGDLVVCTEGPCLSVDGGVGVVLQVKNYDFSRPDTPTLSVHVQWAHEDLWYDSKDLEVISESR